MVEPQFQQRFERITMEWQYIRAALPIAPGIFIQDPKIVDSYIGQGLRSCAFELEALVLGQTRPDKVVETTETVSFEYPASPFQHWKFKHKTSWWLKWFIRHRPIIIATQLKQCKLRTSWDMADVYPLQTVITEPRLGEPYVVINSPVHTTKVWEVPDE